MIKEATTGLAKSCRDLCAEHRWMISGTPLCNRVEDLNGELQFLRVWPFSLSNKNDGRYPGSCGSRLLKG